MKTNYQTLENWISVLARIGLIVLFAYAGIQHVFAADADFSAGVGGGNGACGSFEPTATVTYDRDGDTIPGHIKLGVGPNGSCNGQALTVDVVVNARYYFREQVYTFAGAGYDLRTVVYEFEPAATKQFYGQQVTSAQALVGFGYDFGDAYCQLAYNAVKTGLVGGGNLFPMQVTCSVQVLGTLEVNGTTNIDTHSVDATYDLGPISVSASVGFGYHKLGNPAPAFLQDMQTGKEYLQLGAPNPLYRFKAEWNF